MCPIGSMKAIKHCSKKLNGFINGKMYHTSESEDSLLLRGKFFPNWFIDSKEAQSKSQKAFLKIEIDSSSKIEMETQ